MIRSNDIVVLTECWFTDDCEISDYDLNDFNNIVIKRTKCRGGGICILIKKWLERKITFIKQIKDSIVWLKLDSSLFHNNSDIYLCCAYVPPEESQYD